MLESASAPRAHSWPHPLPPWTVLVGPAGSEVGEAGRVARVKAAGPLLASADAQADAAGPACLLIDGAQVEPGARGGELARQLDALLSAHPGTLAILLYDSLDAADLAELFHAGLFAALPRPVASEQWAATLSRVRARRARWREGQALRLQGEQTVDRLRAHRRQLQEQLALVGEQLITSQARLEQSNQELTEHMGQLALLYRIGRELSGARNWDATLENLLGNLAGFLGARGAALVLRGAPDAPYTPRRSFGWEESVWDRVLVRLESELGPSGSARQLSPGIFQMELAAADAGQRAITALPLDHQDTRLGFLLLLDWLPPSGDARERHLPFLQAVQVILADEVAGAQMLDRIRELGAFNARVLETVRSGIWVVDESGRTIYCNRCGRRLLTGVDRQAATDEAPDTEIGRGRGEGGARDAEVARDWLPLGPDLPELFLEGRIQLTGVAGAPFARLFWSETGVFRGEGRLLRPDGATIPVLLQTSLMPGRGRDERWLVLVVEDLSEAKRLEAERVRADGLQGLVEMSAALAHEIRNPLMGLSAQAELLAGQLTASDARKRYLDVIIAEVERINATITRLLGFVRPYEPRLARANIADLAGDCLALLAAQASQRQLRLRLELSPDERDPSAWEQDVDGGQIKQVLLNLLLNALDAAPPRTDIVLALRLESGVEWRDRQTGAGQLAEGTVLEVRDAGPGFAAGEAERLFRPFYSTKSAGTGLGLSICRKIVVAHGGEIRALCENGQTIFRVLLPRQGAAGAREEA